MRQKHTKQEDPFIYVHHIDSSGQPWLFKLPHGYEQAREFAHFLKTMSQIGTHAPTRSTKSRRGKRYQNDAMRRNIERVALSALAACYYASPEELRGPGKARSPQTLFML